MTKTGKITLAVVAALAVGGAALAAGGHGGWRGMGHFDGHGHGSRNGATGAALFERFDLDGDGAITEIEIEDARAERFAAIDADGDGGVSLEELTALMASRAAEQAERMMMRADGDGDGMIRADEMYGRGADRMFERLDADGDGVITKAEAGAMRHGRRHGHRED